MQVFTTRCRWRTQCATGCTRSVLISRELLSTPPSCLVTLPPSTSPADPPYCQGEIDPLSLTYLSCIKDFAISRGSSLTTWRSHQPDARYICRWWRVNRQEDNTHTHTHACTFIFLTHNTKILFSITDYNDCCLQGYKIKISFNCVCVLICHL